MQRAALGFGYGADIGIGIDPDAGGELEGFAVDPAALQSRHQRHGIFIDDHSDRLDPVACFAARGKQQVDRHQGRLLRPSRGVEDDIALRLADRPGAEKLLAQRFPTVFVGCRVRLRAVLLSLRRGGRRQAQGREAHEHPFCEHGVLLARYLGGASCPRLIPGRVRLRGAAQSLPSAVRPPASPRRRRNTNRPDYSPKLAPFSRRSTTSSRRACRKTPAAPLCRRR